MVTTSEFSGEMYGITVTDSGSVASYVNAYVEDSLPTSYIDGFLYGLPSNAIYSFSNLYLSSLVITTGEVSSERYCYMGQDSFGVDGESYGYMQGILSNYIAGYMKGQRYLTSWVPDTSIFATAFNSEQYCYMNAYSSNGNGNGNGNGGSVGSGDYTVIRDISNSTLNRLSLRTSAGNNGPLVYKITSLPSSGLLYDSGTLIDTVPYTIQNSSRWVKYIPTTGTLDGSEDNFEWSASGIGIFEESTATINIIDWFAPVGIPVPDFGITQTVSGIYGSSTYYTHYVDNTHPSSTDSANPSGTENKPRETIPNLSNLDTGSVLYIHAGAYDTNIIYPTISGDVSTPIFIRGNPNSYPTVNTSKWQIQSGSQYYIIEHLDLVDTKINMGGSYGAVRYSNFRDHTTSYPFGVGGGDSYMVAYNCTFHDAGDWQADFDQDYHGIYIWPDAHHIWIIDSEIWHNSGNGIQINAGSEGNNAIHHIYVGRNIGTEIRQAFITVKQASDVIISQNTVYNRYPQGGSGSNAAIGFQYGPERVWFLYNHIYDCSFGIVAGSNSGGTGQDSYFIGNLIHNIHETGSYNQSDAWSGAAIMLAGGVNRYIVNNTIYDVDAGINGPGGDGYYMANNIISNVIISSETPGYHTYIQYAHAASLVDTSLFYQNGDDVQIRWGGNIYNLSEFQSATGKGAACVSSDPFFINESSDFRIQSSSAAVNSAATHEVYTIFSSLYGLNIRTDIEGTFRESLAPYDMGAYEYSGG